MNTKRKYFFTDKGNESFIAYLSKIQNALHEAQKAINKPEIQKFKNDKKTPLEEFVKNLKDADPDTKIYLKKDYVNNLVSFEVKNYLNNTSLTSNLMRFFCEFSDSSGINNLKSLWKSATAVTYLDDKTISRLGTAYNTIKYLPKNDTPQQEESQKTTELDLSSLTNEKKETLKESVVSRDVVNRLLDLFGADKSQESTYFHAIDYEPIVAKNKTNDAREKAKEENEINNAREKAKQKIEEICRNHRHFKIGLNDIYVDFQEELKIPTNIKVKIDQHSLRLIITGSLGIGKTTYLKKLALSILDTKEASVAPYQVPLFINLREYVDETKKNNVNLLCYIAKYYQFDSVDPLRKLLLGESDTCILLLDSLDQIGSIPIRH